MNLPSDLLGEDNPYRSFTGQCWSIRWWQTFQRSRPGGSELPCPWPRDQTHEPYSQVNAEQAIGQGVQVGDVIITVGEWSAEGASIGQVVAQIKKHKSRPLKLTFASPSDEDEFEFWIVC